MKCPIDDSPLSVSSREGVEIDFCPQCRGVWLDRGELDKIIDRAANAIVGAGPAAAPAPRDSATDDDDARPAHDERPRDVRSRGERSSDRKRKRRSFLEDLFDFD